VENRPECAWYYPTTKLLTVTSHGTLLTGHEEVDKTKATLLVAKYGSKHFRLHQEL
jgi:hypothetical protein